jgi:hypothetical protein
MIVDNHSLMCVSKRFINHFSDIYTCPCCGITKTEKELQGNLNYVQDSRTFISRKYGEELC